MSGQVFASPRKAMGARQANSIRYEQSAAQRHSQSCESLLFRSSAPALIAWLANVSVARSVLRKRHQF